MLLNESSVHPRIDKQVYSRFSLTASLLTSVQVGLNLRHVPLAHIQINLHFTVIEIGLTVRNGPLVTAPESTSTESQNECTNE